MAHRDAALPVPFGTTSRTRVEADPAACAITVASPALPSLDLRPPARRVPHQQQGGTLMPFQASRRLTAGIPIVAEVTF